MSDAALTLALSGLTPLEASELKSALTKAGCDPDSGLQTRQEQGAVTGAKKGEPFTILAIVSISQLALSGLAIYLAKSRSRSRRKLKLSYSSPSGELLTFELEIEAHHEDAIRAEVMEKIAKLKIPMPELGTGAA
jgi:hypothetical protein